MRDILGDKMKQLYLQLQVYAGGTIDKAAVELVQLADRFEIPIGIRFNGIDLIASPDYYSTQNTRVKSIIADYEKQIGFSKTEGRYAAAAQRASKG